MKHSDFKKEYKSLSDDNIIRDQVYTIKIPKENFEGTYDLIGLHKFVEEQNENWNNFNFNNYFKDSTNFFSKLLLTIENVVLKKFVNPIEVNREINKILNTAKNTILLANSPKVIFLTNLNNKYPELFNGAFDGFTENIQSNNIVNKNYLKGLIASTNFEIADLDILSLKESEEISFSTIRNKYQQDNNDDRENFEELFNNSKQKSEDEIENLKNITIEWNETFSKNFSEWTDKVKTEISTSEKAAKRLLKKSLATKIELEQTYREQMKFQVPAEYWKQRATELNIEGHKFMRWLITLVIVGATMLFLLLWLTPEDMLESIFSKEPVRAIRWSIIFVTFISFLFFGIQAVKKAMFSSFHLARDAEEREKLTVFYLSLIKDSTITQEDRSLVLQSLFCRADTGMLKDDGNPTMPGIFDKIKS
ncbi:hypothetical protein J0383_20230 [Flavobacterium endoglycinae]|uniref:DUF6161 domain-containing protein n=1 Tax=Flavobacterium endoglycinae TaxID=2816357 RepID=A0ABX7QDR5_9FLAO|nr:DUF6161 domain-containing protein [Flavobacterium endoglycinae]QSW88556.1 hypothetical protein J0383_20230 [Flavobacterium endoglycinae]